jgi:two-component system cell cycle response regulator CpdR
MVSVHPEFTPRRLGWGFTRHGGRGSRLETMIRILLAEDDESLRGFLARALEKAGYQVTSCQDGDEAVAALDEDFDLLLTDIVMPGVDGIEVARIAAARQPSLRIMFITGFAAVALTAKEQAPAGAKVLSKPIHLREIVAEVERMCQAA